MRINPAAIVLALLVLAAAGTGYWVYQHVEPYTVNNPDRFSTKALRDPYLAADYFLRDLGVKPRREGLQQQLARLPPHGTVLLTIPNALLTDRQAATLLQWVRNGGHLLTTAGENSHANPDPLLRDFGVHRRTVPHWLQTPAEQKSTAKDHRQSDRDEQPPKLSEQLREFNKQLESGVAAVTAPDAVAGDLTAIVLDNEATPLHVIFDPDYVLEHPDLYGDDKRKRWPTPLYWAQVDERVHFMQFDVGKGLLTVVSDLDYWTSRQIGKADHALALQKLVDTRYGVSLIADADMPPLPTLLWHWAPEIILASSVLLALWVWRRSRRFGPIRDPELQVRRSLREHIGASATYLWRDGHADKLLAPLRSQVQRAAGQHFSEFHDLDTARRAALLHSVSGLGEAAIFRALFTPTDRNANEFRDVVALLQRLLQLLASTPT